MRCRDTDSDFCSPCRSERYPLFVLGSILLLLTVAGCTQTFGNRNVEDIGRYLSIEKGRTTKSDIYHSFGQPHDVAYTGGDSKWVYYKIKSSIHGSTFVPFVGLITGGVNYDVHTSEFYFDARGTLSDVRSWNKLDYVNQWEGLSVGVVKALQDNRSARVEKEMDDLGKPFDPKITRQMQGIDVIDHLPDGPSEGVERRRRPVNWRRTK